MALVASTALSSCGGDGGDAPTSPLEGEKKSASDRYAERATTICRKERRAIIARLTNSSGMPPAEAMEEVVLPGFRRQYEGLRKLWPPRGDEDFLDLMLSKFSRSLENGEEDLTRLFRVKLSSYSEFAEGTLMTDEYGIEGCGSLGRSPQAVYRGFGGSDS